MPRTDHLPDDEYQAVVDDINRTAKRRKLTDYQRKLWLADQSPRCLHVKTDGVRCGSPALRGSAYCYFHESIHNPPYEWDFPALEDANAVQLAIMQVLNGIRRAQLDPRTAGLMLYALQTASANLKRVHLEPSPDKIVLEDPLHEERRLRLHFEAGAKAPASAPAPEKEKKNA